ncbi:hypothetical protein LOTGIDRAFT_167242 [Lottia gigantea]|uniref:Uncharacterized protein n=1 Tax=Lottia gigantea TaxID=225164 RepID=V4BDD9_LOTGI|nr:hypothetical protein LOTGIDRAFT_167242 [Lottia gigantea]ESO86429.1 hypothetical protein LOTGIDRAFT_167242 [Lottia gigantea]
MDEKSGAKEILEGYAKSSTIHGFSRIVDVKLYKGRRVLWTIVVLMMWLALVVLVYEEVTGYMSNPTFTEIQSRMVSPKDFPAISFCDPNYLRNTLLEDMEQSDRIRVLRSIDFLKEWDLQSNDTNSVSYKSQSQHTSESRSKQTDPIVTALLNKLKSHRNPDLFNMKCSWGEKWRSCKAAFTTSVSLYGICLTLNPHRLVAAQNSHPNLLSILRGIRYIYKQPNISNANVEFKGVKLIIHDANEDPMSSLRGYYVHSGTFTEISITKTLSINLPVPYKSFAGSGCLMPGPDQIKRFLKYSRSSCELECFMNYTISQCGCRHFLFRGIERLCSVQEMGECVTVQAGSYDLLFLLLI